MQLQIITIKAMTIKVRRHLHENCLSCFHSWKSMLNFVYIGVPFDVISQAQKLFRYANSALEHEDISTAVTNCEQVLQLLRPYNN
jgi:predicted aconitase